MRCHPRLPTEDPAHERRKNPGKKNLWSNSPDRRKVHVVEKQYRCNFLRARNRSFEGKPSFLIPWPHLVGMLEVRCWFRDSRQFNFVFLTFPKSIGRITTNSSCTNGQWSQSSESSAAVHHSEATSFNKTKSGLTPQTGTLPQHVGLIILIANCFFFPDKKSPRLHQWRYLSIYPSTVSILSLSFSFLASTIDTKLWLHNFSQYFLQNAGSSSCSCVKIWKTWSKNRGRWEQLTL